LRLPFQNGPEDLSKIGKLSRAITSASCEVSTVAKVREVIGVIGIDPFYFMAIFPFMLG
jgi:hypothetical protein